MVRRGDCTRCFEALRKLPCQVVGLSVEPLLRPYSTDALRADPVGLLVNIPCDDVPGCLEQA